MPTPAEIEEAAAQSALEPASTSIDGESVTALDPLKTLQLADRISTRAAVRNRKAGWRGISIARGQTQGPGRS